MIRLYNQLKYFIQLLILIALSVFLVYYIPAAFSRWLFLLFLIPVWRSKNDFFWFAFLLVMLDIPGGLFTGTGLDDPYRLPFYNLAPGVSFGFEQFYIFILLLKGIFKKRWLHYKSFVYRKQYRNLGIYLIILILISLWLGMSSLSMRVTYKTLIKLSLYFSTIFVFTKEDDVIDFFKTLFPFAFMAVLFQMYGMVYHQQFVALFKPGVTVTQGVLEAGQMMRPIELCVVLLICFFGSLLYMNCKNGPFAKYYLNLILVVSYIGILMTATRSWFVGFSIMFIFNFILNYRKMVRNVFNFAIGLGVFLLVMFLSPLIKSQTEQSWTRLKTVELLYKGDITAGGTLSRLTERAPRVMEGFNKSTIIFGAGFSDLYYKYGDGHVGFQNILLHSGIVGFLLLFSFALTLFFKPYNISKKADARSDLKSILLNLPLLVPAVLFINSGTQFWGFDLTETNRIMLLAFYISISSVYIKAYKHSSLANLERKLK